MEPSTGNLSLLGKETFTSKGYFTTQFWFLSAAFGHRQDSQGQIYTLIRSSLSRPLCMHVKYELMTLRKLFNVQFEIHYAEEMGINLHATRT